MKIYKPTKLLVCKFYANEIYEWEKILTDEQKQIWNMDVLISYEAFKRKYCWWVRKLSQVFDVANEAAFVETYQVIKYVLDTIGLNIEQNNSKSKQWDVVCFSYNYYVRDPDCIRSKRIHIYLGVPFSWRPRHRKVYFHWTQRQSG